MLNVTFLIFRIFERPEMAKIRLWPPGVTIRRVTRWGVYIFYVYRHTLRKKLGFGWFFMFKLTKMTKKRQNMAKMLEFKYFRHFGSPRGHLKAKNNILNYFLCLFRCFLTEQFIKYWLSMNLGFPVYHLCKKTWKSPLPPNHLAEGTVNLQYMYPSGHWCQMSKTKRPRSVYKNDTIQTPLDKTNYWWLLEWDVRMKDFHFFWLKLLFKGENRILLYVAEYLT
jgi:hypothetical protein